LAKNLDGKKLIIPAMLAQMDLETGQLKKIT
jgi:hypothetical protein